MTQQPAPSRAPQRSETQAMPDISQLNGLLLVELFDSFIGSSGIRAEVHLIYKGELFRIKAGPAAEVTSWLRMGQRAQRLIVWKRYPDDTLSGIYMKPGYKIPDWLEQYQARLAQGEEAKQ